MPLDNYVLYDYFMLIIRMIFAVIAVILLKYVKPVLKEWYEEKVDNKIKKVIKDCVEAAEQTIKGTGMGQTKKSDVMRAVLDFIEKKGYNIDDKTISNMIEAAVFAMNLAKNNQKKDG